MLKVNSVHKRFGDFVALDDVSLEVPEKSIFGLLGSNGAGKTTLIRIINQILYADKGNVYLGEQEINQDLVRKVGYMPEERGLYPKMSVGAQLMFLGQIKGMSQKDVKKSIKYWFERLEIDDWWNKKVDQLSKGMQQKVQFISTVINDPMLLILDEPFTGLDPVNTNLLKNIILELNTNGTTIVFSTHRMEQVEELCSDIVIINEGVLKIAGSVSDLKHRFKKNAFRVILNENISEEDLPFDILSIDGGDSVTFSLREGQSSNHIIEYFIKEGKTILHFEELLPSLNDIFIEVV